MMRLDEPDAVLNGYLGLILFKFTLFITMVPMLLLLAHFEINNKLIVGFICFLCIGIAIAVVSHRDTRLLQPMFNEEVKKLSKDVKKYLWSKVVIEVSKEHPEMDMEFLADIMLSKFGSLIKEYLRNQGFATSDLMRYDYKVLDEAVAEIEGKTILE